MRWILLLIPFLMGNVSAVIHLTATVEAVLQATLSVPAEEEYQLASGVWETLPEPSLVTVGVTTRPASYRVSRSGDRWTYEHRDPDNLKTSDGFLQGPVQATGGIRSTVQWSGNAEVVRRSKGWDVVGPKEINLSVTLVGDP